MTQAATVTAEDLVRALKRRKAALPAEIGSFGVLEACDALLHASPARVTAAQVLISEDGHIQLAPAPSCPEPEATQALHQLLAFMLVAWSDPKVEPVFLKKIRASSAVLECHHVTGAWNYLLKIRIRTTRELEAFLSDTVKAVPGVQRTETIIALSSAKETWALDVSE